MQYSSTPDTHFLPPGQLRRGFHGLRQGFNLPALQAADPLPRRPAGPLCITLMSRYVRPGCKPLPVEAFHPSPAGTGP